MYLYGSMILDWRTATILYKIASLVSLEFSNNLEIFKTTSKMWRLKRSLSSNISGLSCLRNVKKYKDKTFWYFLPIAASINLEWNFNARASPSFSLINLTSEENTADVASIKNNL